jgi:hypothetical protein
MQHPLGNTVISGFRIKDAQRYPVVARQHESVLRIDKTHLAGGFLHILEIERFVGLVDSTFAVIELDQHHQETSAAPFGDLLAVYLNFNSGLQPLKIGELDGENARGPAYSRLFGAGEPLVKRHGRKGRIPGAVLRESGTANQDE